MNKILKITIAVVLCLIVILAVVLLATQCSSNNPTESTTTPTTSTTTSTTPTPTTPVTPECTEHVDANNDYICDACEAELEKPECTEHIDADADYICDNCEAQLERPTVDVFVETNDKIYVFSDTLVIRSSLDTNTDDNIIAWARTDDMLERIGYYSEGPNTGMSKILYNGQECFVGNSAITTQKPIVIEDGEPETVYFTGFAKVYTRPSLISANNYSEEVAYFTKGNSTTRLGVATDVYADGEITFAKIKYTDSKGIEQIGYVDNKLLSTTAPTEPNPDGEITFSPDTGKLIVIADSFNLRISTKYIENDDSQIAKSVNKNTELEILSSGIEESDQTTWYKVLYEGETYYVIFNTKYVKLVETNT